jgi:hypothetical protein
VFRAVAVNGDSAFADLQQELAVFGELEDLSVAGTVARQPDIVLVVDGNAVLAASRTTVAIGPVLLRARGAFRERRKETAAIEPFVASVTRRPAPSLDVVPVSLNSMTGGPGVYPFSVALPSSSVCGRWNTQTLPCESAVAPPTPPMSIRSGIVGKRESTSKTGRVTFGPAF